MSRWAPRRVAAWLLGTAGAAGAGAAVAYAAGRFSGVGSGATALVAALLAAALGAAVVARALRRDLLAAGERIAELRRELGAESERAAVITRQMEERTRGQEQRHQELGEALEKLRRAQDDILRNEKMASLGRLVAGIAHEVNNPMNAVLNSLGPLEEALGRLASSPDPQVAGEAGEAQQMLATVKRGAGRTKAIVQGLHHYSRGDTETLKDVNLLRSLDETLDLLRHRLGQIRIVKEIDPAARVTGFAGQVDQVLMNLITNAVQAIGDREGTIRIGLQRAGNEVVLSVADDGRGIDPAVVPRIFDPFFTTKDVGEGTGLGLSIVHGIVERHGGRIDVASEVGKGTTFRVHLPVHAGLIAAVRATGGAS